ncbi:MAG: hypothetical protein ACREDE_03440 [Thermoplasmata archaeon]
MWEADRVVREGLEFGFRLRILDAREGDAGLYSFLGIVEGFPEILTHSESIEQAEIDLTNALIERLKRMQDHESTRLQLDDFPTVQVVRLHLAPSAS